MNICGKGRWEKTELLWELIEILAGNTKLIQTPNFILKQTVQPYVAIITFMGNICTRRLGYVKATVNTKYEWKNVKWNTGD